LSVGEEENMGEKIPRWESELWSYVSSGDGEHCSTYNHCQLRQKGGWCPDDDRERLNRLLDDNERFSFTNYNFIESGACGRVSKMMEMLANKYLKKGRVSRLPVPMKLVSLADEQCAIETRLLPLKVYHGAIWRLREGWVVQLNDNDTSAMRRFTLFHEVFHILAHCKATPVFRKRGIKEGSFNELLADWFAFCILMPKEWVKEKWAEVEDLDGMAEIFDVPKSAMCIKLKRLGLI